MVVFCLLGVIARVHHHRDTLIANGRVACSKYEHPARIIACRNSFDGEAKGLPGRIGKVGDGAFVVPDQPTAGISVFDACQIMPNPLTLKRSEGVA